MADKTQKKIEQQKKIGEKIRFARKKSGMKLRELSEKIGYSVFSISNWECGRRCPMSTTLLDLKEVIGLEIDKIEVEEKPEEIAVS